MPLPRPPPHLRGNRKPPPLRDVRHRRRKFKFKRHARVRLLRVLLKKHRRLQRKRPPLLKPNGCQREPHRPHVRVVQRTLVPPKQRRTRTRLKIFLQKQQQPQKPVIVKNVEIQVGELPQKPSDLKEFPFQKVKPQPVVKNTQTVQRNANPHPHHPQVLPALEPHENQLGRYRQVQTSPKPARLVPPMKKIRHSIQNVKPNLPTKVLTLDQKSDGLFPTFLPLNMPFVAYKRKVRRIERVAYWRDGTPSDFCVG